MPVALICERYPEVVMSLVAVRVEAEGFTFLGDCAVPVALDPEGPPAKLLMGEGVMGVEAQGLAFFGDDPIHVVLVSESNAKVRVRGVVFGKIGRASCR